MGDCRMKIVISRGLLEAANTNHNVISDKALTISTKFAADTTIREVVDATRPLHDLFTQQHKFKLWDCTQHPATDITSWPTTDFPALTGPKSKTLHDAGYFPSGTWLVLPEDLLPSKFSMTDYDDVQYNQRMKIGAETGDSSKATILEFADAAGSTARPLPSQVMGSVSKRFEAEEQLDAATTKDDATRLRLQNQAQRRDAERDRTRKLDERIKKLEEQSSEKNKKVSDQVRRMLVKSRATGDKRLKTQDRLYFECFLDDNGTLTREFRFFSPQDTFARISASFPSKQGCSSSEVIIKTKDPEDASMSTYLRFPVTMRVYEAISHTYLTDQMNTIIVRLYQDGQKGTPSILNDALGDDKMEEATSTDDATDAVQSDAMASSTPSTSTSAGANSTSFIEDSCLSQVISAMEEASHKGKKPKKKSAAALKVRNMQIKSKAKGDGRRVPKVEDRFFLEVVLLDVNNKADSDFYFMARTDPLHRFLSSVTSSAKDPSAWEFLVPQEAKNMFKVISDTAVTLKDAEAAGILNCFGRIIVRPK